jgi:hypothetical protein
MPMARGDVPTLSWKKIFEMWTELLPFDHYLDPIVDLARAVAKRVSAEVIPADPPPEWDENATH